MKRLIPLMVLFLLISGVIVIAEDTSPQCGFWCKFNQILFGDQSKNAVVGMGANQNGLTTTSPAIIPTPSVSTGTPTAEATTTSTTAVSVPEQKTCNTQYCNEIDQVWKKIRIYLHLPPELLNQIWDPTNNWMTPPVASAYQQSIDASQFSFQPGIDRQWNDASEELKSLLACIRVQIPIKKVAIISGISDNHGLTHCQNNWNAAWCSHSQRSAHYGCGGQSKLSLAVDFGDDANTCTIVAAANMCGVPKKHIFATNNQRYKQQCGNDYILNLEHDNHIHISVANARCD